MYGTNSLLGNIMTKVNVDGESLGTSCLIASDMAAAASMFDGEISIVNNGQYVAMSSGRREIELLTMDSDDYPKIDIGHVGDVILMNAQSLKSAISTAALATAKSHHILENVRIGEDGAVGADGLWMAINKGVSLKEEILIPQYLAGMIASRVDSENVGISVSSNKMVIEWGDTVLSSSIISHKFPNYKEIQPKGHTTAVTASVGMARDIVKAATLVSQEKDNLVIITVNPDTSEVEVYAHSGIKKFIDYIPSGMCSIEGEKLEIGVSSKFLLLALKDLESDSFKMEFSGPSGPMVISDGMERMYIIMPMAIIYKK